MILLGDGRTNNKTLKSFNANLGYHTAILYLAPQKTAGLGNLCPHASAGCIFSCLFTAGRGATSPVQKARIKKTLMWYNERERFLDILHDDICKFTRKCTKLGLKPCVRLNGTSDISWEEYIDLESYSDVQFYDYTKNYSRMLKFLDGDFPSNYHLTFSRSETNENECIIVRRLGGNVAVVFKKEVPNKWKRFKVFSGDKHDLRFLDKPGICGLTAKGKARKDATGFVVVA